jgi:general secretion pathway protein M
VNPSALVTPRHARLAVAAYVASLLVVVACGLMLSLGNQELQGEYATKARILDGLRHTGAAGSAKTGMSAAQFATFLAPTETIAASELHKQIVDRLKNAGGSVQSAKAEPTREATIDGLQRLVANLTFDSSVTALQHLLFDLETGVPFMFVDSLAVQPAGTSAASTREDDRLRVTLVASSYWKSNETGQKVTASAQNPPPATAAAPVAEDRTPALRWLKLEDLSATRERPLFAEDRRPRRIAPPPSDPVAVIEPEPEDAMPLPSLKGIIVQGSSTLVLLEDQSTSESVIVRSGDNFGPWQVVAENDHTVRLATGTEQVVLDLFEPQ